MSTTPPNIRTAASQPNNYSIYYYPTSWAPFAGAYAAAPLDSPHADIGPAARAKLHIKSSSSSSSSRHSKSKSTRSSHPSTSSTHHVSNKLAPAPLDSPEASVQPKYRTASKSHPYLTTHGFARHPEYRPLAGSQSTGSHPSSSVHTTASHPLGHIIPGLGGLGHPSNTIHNTAGRIAQGTHGPSSSGIDPRIAHRLEQEKQMMEGKIPMDAQMMHDMNDPFSTHTRGGMSKVHPHPHSHHINTAISDPNEPLDRQIARSHAWLNTAAGRRYMADVRRTEEAYAKGGMMPNQYATPPRIDSSQD